MAEPSKAFLDLTVAALRGDTVGLVKATVALVRDDPAGWDALAERIGPPPSNVPLATRPPRLTARGWGDRI